MEMSGALPLLKSPFEWQSPPAATFHHTIHESCMDVVSAGFATLPLIAVLICCILSYLFVTFVYLGIMAYRFIERAPCRPITILDSIRS